MKLLIDMNLSPIWVTALQERGQDAVHWITVGSPDAKDCEILKWAKERGYVLVTHDLDFGAILAASGANCPSVIQIRTEDPIPSRCIRIVLSVLRNQTDMLNSGALISVDENRARVRILPLK